MFRNPELDRLHLQKQVLILEGDVQRLQLATDWKRLRSTGLWRTEAAGLAKRHPVLAAALAAGGGALLIMAVRRPGGLLGSLGRLGGMSSTVLSLLKLLRRT